MIKKIKIFLFAMLATTVVLPVLPTSAVTKEATTESTTTTTQDAAMQQTAATTAETATTPVVTDRSGGRAERVKAYKEKLQDKLTATKEKRITTRCKAAQAKVTTLRTRIQTAITNRKNAYQTISEKVDTAVQKLKKAGVDTTKLEAARETIRTDLVSLDENMNAYDTVLADLETMDCVADPTTFQAALESARDTQKSLREQAQALRKFATTDVKAILEEMKASLTSKTTTTETTTEGGTQ